MRSFYSLAFNHLKIAFDHQVKSCKFDRTNNILVKLRDNNIYSVNERLETNRLLHAKYKEPLPKLCCVDKRIFPQSVCINDSFEGIRFYCAKTWKDIGLIFTEYNKNLHSIQINNTNYLLTSSNLGMETYVISHDNKLYKFANVHMFNPHDMRNNVFLSTEDNELIISKAELNKTYYQDAKLCLQLM